jgi:hypothetical protein
MNLKNAPFHQMIRIPGITPLSELGNGGIRRPPSVDNAAAAPQIPTTAKRTVATVEQMLVQAEELARTDTSQTREQYFAHMLRQNPAAYEAYLQAQSRSEAPEQTWP